MNIGIEVKRTLLIIILLSLVSCTKPMIISDSLSGNTIKYDPLLRDRADIDKISNEMCSQYGKKATFIRSQNVSPVGIGFNFDNYKCQ